MRHAHTRATAVPADLVEAQARANSACEKVWREARRAVGFRPGARRIWPRSCSLTRQQAAALAPALGLLGLRRADGRLPARHRRAADVAPVFAAYEDFLREALPRAEEIQARKPAPHTPAGSVPGRHAGGAVPPPVRAAGLEPAHARLDRSAHPFCGGTPTDVRITTRYDEADFSRSLMGVLHETGHALYERGLPARPCPPAGRRGRRDGRA